jgi:hypothetical protein
MKLSRQYLQLKMASNPTSASDDESTSNISAEYREWPICGVFKGVIVGKEVRDRMEFSLEQLYSLTRYQHIISFDSTDGGDSQPGGL